MNSAPSGWIAGERLLLRGGERVHRIPGDSCFGGGRSYGFEPRYNSRNLGAPKVERLTFFLQVIGTCCIPRSSHRSACGSGSGRSHGREPAFARALWRRSAEGRVPRRGRASGSGGCVPRLCGCARSALPSVWRADGSGPIRLNPVLSCELMVGAVPGDLVV